MLGARYFLFCFAAIVSSESAIVNFTIAASPLTVAAKQNQNTIWHPGQGKAECTFKQLTVRNVCMILVIQWNPEFSNFKRNDNWLENSGVNRG